MFEAFAVVILIMSVGVFGGLISRFIDSSRSGLYIDKEKLRRRGSWRIGLDEILQKSDLQEAIRLEARKKVK